MSERHSTSAHPDIARLVRTFSIPVILFWVLTVGALGAVSPKLEEVATQHAVSTMPEDSLAFQAMMRIGKVFHEFSSDSSAMVVLEGQEPLGDSAHEFYNRIVSQLRADVAHVEHVQDFWGDPLTAASTQSGDGKAAYVQVFLVGNQGTAASNESVAAVRRIVDQTPAPAGIKAYVAGNTVLVGDTVEVAHKSFAMVAMVSLGVIFVMLLVVYRSVLTTFLSLVVVVIELLAAQSVTAFLGHLELIGLTPNANSTITALSIAAGTDYLIFLLGRYHEARAAGEDRETAFGTAYHGVSHVILASGLTVAGACMCLAMTRLPYFQTMGMPCAVAMLVVVSAALTLAPAVLALASRFGAFDPKRELSTRNWRKIGTAVVRWPKPIIVVTAMIAVIGFVGLLTYVPSYNDQKFTPPDMPANVGYAAVERHFSQARMNPEFLMVEADHDLRNPAGMLVIDRIAKRIFHERGVARVQTITRPLGAPLEHSSIPFQISLRNAGTLQTAKFLNDNAAEMLQMADEMGKTIAIMEHTYAIMKEMADTTHSMADRTHEVVGTADELRDHIADFDDFFRPIRSYFYWEQHCADIPVCWSMRSVFDGLDAVDKMSAELEGLSGDIDHLDRLMPSLLADFEATIASLKRSRALTLSTQTRMAGIQALIEEAAEGATQMGRDFDQAKNDDSFYLPPEVFDNPDFQRVMQLFVSPDGKAVRFVITHDGDPASVEGIRHIAGIKYAVADAIKGTPLANARISLTGAASMYADIQRGTIIDVLVAGISALILIFAIMLLVTRSVVAALVIVGTVAASLGTACGLSVLVWQDLLGCGVQWLALPLAVIILLAVGSDYNLLVVSRLKEGIHAGLNTAIIRGMGATGRVATAAGLVFAFTMMAMLVSDLLVVGQIGTTIGLGLLVDTLIVRSFMLPAIAAALGRWFWWPLNTVRAKPLREGKGAPSTRQAHDVSSNGNGHGHSIGAVTTEGAFAGDTSSVLVRN
ncbi:MMPL family transporter [Mycobacterium intermedium]|uniref:MMPL/RND family transporter n=1 Tax=Mycobacterium intermedium TaxID=28445 RepID=UPI0009A182C7|nr:MMPL family transporter [Mycobacterium intermedium]MCV6966473.1 MMPL family transporter [Mycobacterium intermedium]